MLQPDVICVFSKAGKEGKLCTTSSTNIKAYELLKIKYACGRKPYIFYI
jgi:hypothetical protein